MLNPAYKIVLGNRVVDTTDDPQTSSVTELIVRADMDVPVNSIYLSLGNVGGLRPETDQDVSIDLGYADDGDLQRVFTGTVSRVVPGLLRTSAEGVSGAWLLLHSFTDITYENKSAADIVSELAAQAGLRVGESEAGIRFPAYVVDGRRSFHEHMARLAGLCGFDLYFNEQNQLIFKKFSRGNSTHVIDYARHILELYLQKSRPAAGQVQAWGESPAGGQSEDAWAWLTKDFSSSMASAGSDEPVLLVESPALRTSRAASKTAAAVMENIEHNTRQGRLVIAGNPAIRLGDAIRLREVPRRELNTSWQVRAVEHRISKENGFTTTVDFRGI